MTNTPQDKPAPVWPEISEEKWYFLAIVASLFTGVAAILSAAWVFSEDDPVQRQQMVATLAPFGTIPLAMITFCTVAWRGMVTSRQADQQRRQNDAADDANFAKLLQEGAKLLADEKTPNQLAGIASLNILLGEPKARYANEAREVLSESMKNMVTINLKGKTIPELEETSIFASINTLLIREAENDRFSNVRMSLKFDAVDSNFTYWPIFAGFADLTIDGGHIMRAEKVFERNKSVTLRNVSVIASECYKTDYRFIGCKFAGCRIKAFDNWEMFSNTTNEFVKCDFSECEFDLELERVDLKKFTFRECWYDIERPPNFQNAGIIATEFFRPRIKLRGRWLGVDDVDIRDEDLTESQRRALSEFFD